MSTETLSEQQINEVSQRLESQDAQAVLKWGIETFFPKIGFASSFGAEDVVVIALLAEIKPEATIFTLDTGRLPEETYEVMDQIRERFPGLTDKEINSLF